MAHALTADDLMPLTARLSTRQRHLLAQRRASTAATQHHEHRDDAGRYRLQPVQPREAVDGNAGLVFDPEGWDEFCAPR